METYYDETTINVLKKGIESTIYSKLPDFASIISKESGAKKIFIEILKSIEDELVDVVHHTLEVISKKQIVNEKKNIVEKGMKNIALMETIKHYLSLISPSNEKDQSAKSGFDFNISSNKDALIMSGRGR